MVAGTEIKITPDGVFITTPNIFKVKANQHIFENGATIGMPPFPILPKAYSLRFHFTDDNDIPYPHTPYIATNKATGEVIKGMTDKDGLTQFFYSDAPEDVEVHLEIGEQNDK